MLQFENLIYKLLKFLMFPDTKEMSSRLNLKKIDQLTDTPETARYGFKKRNFRMCFKSNTAQINSVSGMNLVNGPS